MSQANTNIETAQETVTYQTSKDLTNAIFIVSVLLNLAVLIAWLLVTTSSQYSLLLLAN